MSATLEELPHVRLKNISNTLAQYYCDRIESLLPNVNVSTPIAGQLSNAKATIAAMIDAINESELLSQRLAALYENIKRIG